jgi:hypothetical protein
MFCGSLFAGLMGAELAELIVDEVTAKAAAGAADAVFAAALPPRPPPAARRGPRKEMMRMLSGAAGGMRALMSGGNRAGVAGGARAGVAGHSYADDGDLGDGSGFGVYAVPASGFSIAEARQGVIGLEDYTMDVDGDEMSDGREGTDEDGHIVRDDDDALGRGGLHVLVQAAGSFVSAVVDGLVRQAVPQHPVKDSRAHHAGRLKMAFGGHLRERTSHETPEIPARCKCDYGPGFLRGFIWRRCYSSRLYMQRLMIHSLSFLNSGRVCGQVFFLKSLKSR